MHVEVTPQHATVAGGEEVRFGLLVSNPSETIDAYSVRVFGLDPMWVIVSPERLSLFPGDVAVVDLTIRLPAEFPAGQRQLSIHVQSENDPADFSLANVSLDITDRPRLFLVTDPVSVTGGTRTQFNLVVGNLGNNTIEVTPDAVDPEEQTQFDFAPGNLYLLPGQQEVIRARVKAPRPWIGQSKTRVLTFSARTPEPTETMATFIQRPRIGRWLISLIGLITAAAVFAAVIFTTLSSIVDEASVDPRILNEALSSGAAGGETVPVDPATVSARVVSATTNDPVAGVQAELFLSDNGVVPVASAATGDDGSFAFGRLSGGTYRLKLSGAGFSDLWYPGGRTFAEADDIKVTAGKPTPLPDIAIGGRPGGVGGRVIADDPTGARAALLLEGAADPSVPAVVGDVDVSADGSFAFADVPSPATYQLVVTRPGSATERRVVLLGPGQVIDDINIRLRPGDGVISGRVITDAGALGGVDIVADDGSARAATVSLTEGDVGFFALRGLATPGRYTVTISREGFTSETRTVTLGDGEQVGDLTIVLASAVGSISGLVAESGVPAGGVTVAVTGAGVEVVTTTISQGAGVGTYSVGSLPTPGTYTVTFSRTGLISQVRLVDLGSGGTSAATGIDANLVRSTAVVAGTVSSTSGTPLPSATIELTDGTNRWTTTTADEPAGAFSIGNVPPGAYTLTADLVGANQEVVLVNVAPGQVTDLDIELGEQASLFGRVEVFSDEANGFVPYVGGVVRLYAPGAFPGPPTAALASATLDETGTFRFPALSAPDDFIVAVYDSAGSIDALDSRLVQTQPGVAVEVEVIQLQMPVGVS